MSPGKRVRARRPSASVPRSSVRRKNTPSKGRKPASQAKRRDAAASALALVGLAMLGWGLAMMLGIMPHEERWVGAGLAAFGGALLVTRPGLPRAPRIPPMLMAGLGLAAITLVLGYGMLYPSPLDVPKIAILALGFGLLACAPFVDRMIRLPVKGRPRVPLASLVTWSLAILGAPLAVWAMQAAFKGLVGSTPIEAFVRVALLPPVGGALWILGMNPSFNGQTITYATPQGPLSVDVGAACSGIQAMALFGAVLAVYLIAERPSGRRLAFWSIVGIVGVYLTNLVRLTTLMLVGYAWGSDALIAAHAHAGWVFFVAWALLFAWMARSPAVKSGRRPPKLLQDAARACAPAVRARSSSR